MPIINAMSPSELSQIQSTPESRQHLEEEAAKLNLSLSAYMLYLEDRATPGEDVERLDRHVREVFGRHGKLMRRLAK